MIDKYFTTEDEVKLHYLEGGTGQPLVIVHGWRSEAAEWSFNLDELAKYYHVYFLELRGHGRSGKPDYGYRISRLAKDLQEFIAHFQDKKINLMGHSMGCFVILNYIDLFGQDMIQKLILIDNPTRVSIDPNESDSERKSHGGTFKDIWALYDAFMISSAEGGKEFNRQAPAPEDDISFSSPYYIENQKLPRQKTDNEFMAKLFLNLSTNDVRDIVKRINVPSLYIRGATSRCTFAETGKWITENNSNFSEVVFSRDDYGRHSMFCTNPKKFNSIVREFLN